MAKGDADASRWEAHASRLPQGIEVCHEDLFVKAGWFRQGKLLDKRVAWLGAAAPILREVLEPDERVHVVSRAMVNYTVEMAFAGAISSYINQAIVIVTDRRALFIHSDGKQRPRAYLNQIAKDAIKKVSGSLGSTVIAAKKDRRTLSGIAGADRKTIKRLFPPNPEASGGFQHLCPACFRSTDTWVEQCAHCQAQFKSPRKAALRSLLLPGLGDLYLGHRGFAYFEMFGALMTWIFALGLAVPPEDGSDPVGGYIAAAVLIGLAHGADALLTRWQAKKGLISLDGKLPTAQIGRVQRVALGAGSPG